ncbi:hypothetical protein KC340_g5317 [Hortaea werneckii]|nr:hypothetical protein KC342_g5627 [Hortaea werneckii]KAI7100340.1 hypothetical protein KC339_g7554 [Hortaea werneckii]KAI7242445.1 hypothetical protein KC365_g3152 [Hortaea werneckii]KAI7328001.1 hypothetical protein KC340_g5317 [Hortaea werneckii]KAI7376828.1 hypothetical protein KC328_g14725 [Hortaea werneckii]
MVPPHLKHRMNVNREAAPPPPKKSLQSSRETTSDHPQDLAVIPYDAVKAGEKDAGKASANTPETESQNLKPTLSTPQDLIFHETVRTLLAEVTELRQRCERLEHAHKEISTSMSSLEKASCNALVRAPLTKANLTGYASSDCESTGRPPNAQHSRSDRDTMNDPEIQGKFAAIAQILETYDNRLKAQAVQQQKQEARIKELTEYKRGSEVLFKSLRDELETLDVPISGRENGNYGGGWAGQPSAGDIASELLDRHGRLVGRFNKLETRVEEVLSTQEDDRALFKGSEDGTTSSSSAKLLKPIIGEVQLLEGHHSKIRERVKKIEKRFKYEQLIDDAFDKELLYRHFRDLDRALARGDDDQRRRAGSFEGTFDELWPLRERVLLRLAVFDTRESILEEIEKAA